MTTGYAIVAAIILLIVAMFWSCTSRKEFFSVSENTNTEYNIIRTYRYLLQRDPTPDELKSVKQDMLENNMSFYTLRQLLVDSEEYQRILKTQSDDIAPELFKMMTDRDQIEHIGKMYKEVLKRNMRSEMALPYHDLYVYVFKTNDDLLKDMFMSKDLGSFEKEIMNTSELDRDKLFALYDRMYGIKDIEVPDWWPSLSIRKGTEKERFVMPKILYADDKPRSIASDAGYWQMNYTALPFEMTPPWKEEEITSNSFSVMNESTILPPLQNDVDSSSPNIASAVISFDPEHVYMPLFTSKST